jgi:hypothetical protein
LASLSWCQVAGLLMWGALSGERTGLSFTSSTGSRQRSHSRVRVPQNSWPYFTVSIRDSSNLEGQVPIFISPRNRVARLYPQALGSLFVASYNSQGYGGGIRTRLHAGISTLESWTSQSHVATDGRPVSQSVSLGLLFFDSYGLVFVGRPLGREDGSVFCFMITPSQEHTSELQTPVIIA